MEQMTDKDFDDRLAEAAAEDRRAKASSGNSDLLSADTMRDLGFTEIWPGGNPKEPWWENPAGIDVGDVWITELLPRAAFWELIAEEFREQGREEIRDHLRKALGR